MAHHVHRNARMGASVLINESWYNAEVKGPGITAYAWCVWDKDAVGGTELKWFKLGYKARYNRAS